MAEGREVYFFKNYFFRFYDELAPDVKKKINWVLGLLWTVPFVPQQYLRRITGTRDLYELRIGLSGQIYRIFCTFDEGKIVILFNGFEKKSQKTPRSEIEQAIRIEREYRESKASGKIADVLRRAPGA